MNLKKIGKIVMGKFVGTGPSFYKKRIYPAAVSQRLRNTAPVHCGIPNAYIYLVYGVETINKLLC